MTDPARRLSLRVSPEVHAIVTAHIGYPTQRAKVEAAILAHEPGPTLTARVEALEAEVARLRRLLGAATEEESR